MDANTRWETEALRSGSKTAKKPPRQEAERQGSKRDWVTLKEAEAATGIPSNTLRKWARKASIPSYLESDGDVSLRMVDRDAVIAHAEQLGRTVEPVWAYEAADEPPSEPEPPTAPDGTMIVPLDAWNNMLNQLGNLHEAGQQLAEARERAAKAETEATFLRERLAELREQSTEDRTQSTEHGAQTANPVEVPAESAPRGATYWQYLTSGWRNRKKSN